MPRKRAMTPEQASRVNLSGHKNERDFASLIGGNINPGSPADKKDVIDAQGNSHSVKNGKWWQIFLYSRGRLETNSVFQRIGQVANIMIACIDAYPPDRADYLADKMQAKRNLQPQMRRLLVELQKPQIFNAFLHKAIFDGDDADYLSMFLGPKTTDVSEKIFHIFHKKDVVTALTGDITLRNSKANHKGQTDDLKVTFFSTLHGRNIGEIEDRRDSDIHYREMKFRLNAKDVYEILISGALKTNMINHQIITHGHAIQMFKLP